MNIVKNIILMSVTIYRLHNFVLLILLGVVLRSQKIRIIRFEPAIICGFRLLLPLVLAHQDLHVNLTAVALDVGLLLRSLFVGLAHYVALEATQRVLFGGLICRAHAIGGEGYVFCQHLNLAGVAATPQNAHVVLGILNQLRLLALQ